MQEILNQYFKRDEKNELVPIEENGKIFAILKNKWLEAKPEEIIRQKFIAKLIEEYGYVSEQMAQEVKVSNSKRGSGKAQADIVVWKTKEDKINQKNAFLVIECKAPTIKLKLEDCYQGMNYATWSRAKIFAIYNDNEMQVYKIDESKIPILSDSFKPINDIPKANEILDENKLEKFLQKTKEFKGDEFARLLHKCHNIIRNNDKLSPEAAFDEISKVLFIKIMYERSPKQEGIFSLQQFKKLKSAWELARGKSDKAESYMQKLFEDVKEEFKNDGIFEDNEKIKLKESTFEAIVKELEIYNLTKTGADVKGIAFEKFLSKTFRGQLGQFFTPRTIVDFMVDFINPKENELICDPCVGSGGFIIKAFEKIKENIENEYKFKKFELQKKIFGENQEYLDNKEKQKEFEKILSKLNNEEQMRLKQLSCCAIYGTDANPRMARVAKINMIMHGDGHSGIHHHDGLLNINGIFRNRFDVILTNPPFGITYNNDLPKVQEDDKFKDERLIEEYKKKYGEIYEEELKQVTDNIGKPIRNLFEVGKYTGKSEVLFIERCLDLLKPKGRMGIVLPEGVLNSSDLEKARELFEGRAKIKLIVSLPDEVFLSAGATVKTSLVFLQKYSEEEKNEFEKIKQECENELKEKLKIYEKENQLSIIKKNLRNKKLEKEIKEKLRKNKKEIEKELKQLYKYLETKLMPCVRENFDYEILVADIKKAGITSTGDMTDNELIELLKELKSIKVWE
ncbi:type I restriction enzyme M protein [Lebetimonas natsushimae]|uniref:Type I restriction enzyme M protein n=1 Tax=Lebetimonas natsushimae TaxID=1936991 RepID=A0A292YFX0_9BACT|nr:N-6 DNA methylase [Lebetimonas natsushimae]GAX88011.1 type I restriction enzyme M protein [Lebetimonas natsushimae]